ncbi:hypothetical protein KDK88_10305 [bacterium]|nr:hypothetical protein [bacterium]
MKDAELDSLLHQLHKPALPDPVRKQELRERLMARAVQEKRRSIRQRSTLLAAFMALIVGIHGNAFTHRPQHVVTHESSTSITFQDPSSPDTPRSSTIGENEVVDRVRNAIMFDEYVLAHMSGQDEMVRILGVSLEQGTKLVASYTAPTRFGPMSVGSGIESMLPKLDNELSLRIAKTEMQGMLDAIGRHEVTAFDDTLVTDGLQALTVQRYRFQSDEFGPVVIWHGRKPSGDVRGPEEG